MGSEVEELADRMCAAPAVTALQVARRAVLLAQVAPAAAAGVPPLWESKELGVVGRHQWQQNSYLQEVL